MTVPIVYAGIPSAAVVTKSSRYIKQNVIYWGDRNLMAFDTYLRSSYTPDGNEQVMLVTKGLEYRPDLVSYQYYGFADNWWKILEANKMLDVWDFKAGLTIILPKISSL